jgi:hypothetical protein
MTYPRRFYVLVCSLDVAATPLAAPAGPNSRKNQEDCTKQYCCDYATEYSIVSVLLPCPHGVENVDELNGDWAEEFIEVLDDTMQVEANVGDNLMEADK